MIKNKTPFVGYADVFTLSLIMSANTVFKKIRWFTYTCLHLDFVVTIFRADSITCSIMSGKNLYGKYKNGKKLKDIAN